MSDVKKCPACGAFVKLRNLDSHLQRVHPGGHVEVRLTPDERERVRAEQVSSRPRSSVAWRLGVVGVALIVLAAAVVALYRPSGPGGGPERAEIQLEPLEWDFGNIPRSVVTHTFTVRSIGLDPLRITAISTSCECTSAVLYANGRESPTFGMHGNPTGWAETLTPGQTADLTVRYDPNVHPDTGPIVRVIYLKSDDRSSPEVSVTITANVVP